MLSRLGGEKCVAVVGSFWPLGWFYLLEPVGFAGKLVSRLVSP